MKKIVLNNFQRFSIWLILFGFGSLLFLSSCEKEEVLGPPVITQVRLLDPTKKDSTFAAARPGTQILVEGQNLKNITNIYFNDFPAGFNTVYNTNTNVIVTIPSNATTEATNPNVPHKLRIVTSRGDATYDFVLIIPPPVIHSISNENALPGSVVTVRGSNLWLIERVLIGTVEASGVESNADGTEMEFVMPNLGTTPGRMTIEAKYGTTKSRAPLNMFAAANTGLISNLTAEWETNDPNPAQSEPSVFRWAWWGAQRPSNPADFPGTRGAYLHHIFGGIGAGNGAWWENNRTGQFEGNVQVIPAADISKPAANYAIKFEVNTKEPWTTAICRIRFSDGAYSYNWEPHKTAENQVFDTENQWITVTIPLNLMRTNNGTGTPASTVGQVLPNGQASLTTWILAPENQGIDIFNTAFDNFRIVELLND